MLKSKDALCSENYALEKTGVYFKTNDVELKTVFDLAEKVCLENKKRFSDGEVLIEGAKYNGVWLETQPMGGEMYAKRNLATALNNILIFLRYQRNDGRFPGMITKDENNGKIVPHYNFMQGLFFAQPALKLWYLIGKNNNYLRAVYDGLEAFDNYLWKCRDSDGNGCLESWCIWDTGEDNYTVYMLAGLELPKHGGWGADTPPTDIPLMPMESPQYMAYSYGCRDTLAEISHILKNGYEQFWREKAEAVRNRAKEYLWDEKIGAMFPRDKENRTVYALTQENIKCMYQGLFTQEMADRFISEHLMNPKEFWTPVPLPSIAVNNPYFYAGYEYSNCADELQKLGTASDDIEDNNWSGPCEGLTFQRSAFALMRYGHFAESILIGQKLLHLLKKTPVFAQGYNPFTGLFSKKAPLNYGPTVLAVQEYLSLLCGVHIAFDKVLWTAIEGESFTYTQKMYGKDYTIVKKNGVGICTVDGKEYLRFTGDIRVETEPNGILCCVYGIGTEKTKATVTVDGKKICFTAEPNEVLRFADGKFIREKLVSFAGKYI